MSGNNDSRVIACSRIGLLLRLPTLAALALIFVSTIPAAAKEIPAGLWKGLIYKVPMNECVPPVLPDVMAAKEDVDRINEEIDKFNECLTAYYDKLDVGFETVKSAFPLARTDIEALKLNRKLEEINAATSRANELRKKFDNDLALHNIKVELGNKQRTNK